MAPAQDRLHPRQQLRDLKGLDDIVVRPQLQALDPVLEGVPRGGENDGDMQRGKILHQLEAVAAGEHHIQKNQVIPGFLHRVGGVQAVVHPIAVVARRGQGHVQQVGYGFFVLDDQNFNHWSAPFLKDYWLK